MGEPIEFDHLFDAVVKEESKRSNERYVPGWLPLSLVNVLAQPRKTFEGVSELANDIAEKGVFNPPTVACLSPEQAIVHLTAVGVLYETSYRLEDLVPFEAAHGRVYYILLAGERRFRAHRHIWEKGCDVCRDQYGEESPGVCFGRHVQDQKMEVRLCLGINVLRALFLQLSENTHVSVPPHEEADAYAKLFRLLRHHDSTYPLAQFARKVGRGSETIRRALKYVELPQAIRQLVERKDGARFPYGAAIELARLRDALEETKDAAHALTDEDLLIEARVFFARGQNLESFRKYVQARIENARSGQLGLFGMPSPEEARREKRKLIRREAVRTQARFLDTAIQYASNARTTLEQADAGAVSPRSPARRLLHMAEELVQAIVTYDRSVAGLSALAEGEYYDRCVKLVGRLESLHQVLHDQLSRRQQTEVAVALLRAHAAFDLDTAANDGFAALSR